VDKVGLEQNYYAKIIVTGRVDTDCSIVVHECFPWEAPQCIECYDSTDAIGTCDPLCGMAIIVP